MTITETIRQHIESLPKREPFTAKQLLRFGPRAAVDQALSRLCKAGTIQRVTRGVYAAIELGKWSGRPLPVELPKVLGIIASAKGEVIASHGAYAVNRFGLSTQNQRRPVFLTTGRSRDVVIENEVVSLRHVNAKHLPFGNTTAGLALTAMRYLGRQLKPEHVASIRSQLKASEWQQLKGALGAQPSWLIETALREPQPRPVKP